MKRFMVALFVASTVLSMGLSSPALAKDPEFKLDHFKVYKVAAKTMEARVALKGQFDKAPIRALIEGPLYFANPVSKNGSRILDENAHLHWYTLRQRKEEPIRDVVIRNQFGKYKEQTLVIGKPRFLLAPTAKVHGKKEYPLSKRLDHFKVYEVLKQVAIPTSVVLKDQFGGEENATMEAIYFCVPVAKSHGRKVTEIKNKRDHMTVYIIRPKDYEEEIKTADQFGKFEIKATSGIWLCLPTEKVSFKEQKDR